MTLICPELLNYPDSTVPSTSTLNERRNLIPGLNQLQELSWIERAERIVLCADATYVIKTSLLTIGSFDEQMDFVCIASTIVHGSRIGEVISAKMKAMVDRFVNL